MLKELHKHDISDVHEQAKSLIANLTVVNAFYIYFKLSERLIAVFVVFFSNYGSADRIISMFEVYSCNLNGIHPPVVYREIHLIQVN